MEKKSEEKNVPLVVELPRPALQPVHQRIYVKGFSMEDVKTKGGLIIPTNFVKIKGEQQLEWRFQRYFVLAIADDVTLEVMDGEKKRKLRRGDEISIFYHEDALKYEPAQTMDFITGEKYIVLHETEIAGVYPNTPISDN